MILPLSNAHAITMNPPVQIDTDATDRLSLRDIEIGENGIYVLYRTVLGSPNDIYFSRSTDYGATWSTPNLVATTTDTGFGKIFVRDNGDLGIAYTTIPSDHQLNFIKSTDNGNTWSSPTTSDADFLGFDYSFASDGDVLVFTFSDFDTSSYQGAITSDDFGATWSSTTAIQGQIGCTISCDYSSFEQANSIVHGNNIYVSYFATDNGLGESHTYFVKSNDAGVTWDTPIQISDGDIDNFVPFVIIDEDGGEIIIQYLSSFDGALVYAKSSDGGNTFGSPIILEDLNTCYDSWALSGNGDDVLFACDDQSGFGRHIKSSSDFGDTFGSYSLVNGTGILSASDFPIAIWEGDNIYDILMDGGDPNSPSYLIYSDDRGATFNNDLIIGLNNTQFSTTDYHTFDAFDDIFAFVFTEQVTNPFDTLTIFVAILPNSGTNPPDTTAPIISTIGNEPILILENTVVDYTDYVVCLDDIDGDISMSMIVVGDGLNTSMRGTQNVTFSCTDEATNNIQESIQFIIKKQSTSSGGGSSPSTSQTTSGTQSSTPSLSDIPPLSLTGGTPAKEGGQSISDLFANLFQNRLNPTNAQPQKSIAEQIQERVGEIRNIPAQSVPSTSPASDNRPSPITDFLNNLFGGFFR